jgi:two-component system LytT family sensor kinase
MKTRVALLVATAWVLVGVVWGAQNALGANLQGRTMPLSGALRASFVQSLPWIPVTLAVIAITVRFPLARTTWRRRIIIHFVGALLVAYAANVLVVLGFWFLAGRFGGLGALAREAAFWTTLRLHIALLIYAAIAALTHAFLYYRETRDRELRLARVEGQLARARLQALNAQIRPHFLFNTLHTIGQMWRSGNSDDADAVLDHLGNLFHKVQSSTSQAEVALAEELELVREYLAIEQARFRDRMRTVVHATPAALECLVPPLILQPLVENAVRHGIFADSAAGIVEVLASVEDGQLQLTVRDDGPGFNAVPARPGTGTGLRNTRERLAQLYGAAATLRMETGPSGGTLIRLVMPARDGAHTLADTPHG